MCIRDRFNSNQEIINASANTFSDDWKSYCATRFDSDIDNNVESFPGCWSNNPFIEGRKGNWRPYKNYVLYHARNSENFATDNSMRIRDKGLVDNFSPFWNLSSNVSELTTATGTVWILANRAEHYDIRGNQLEAYDALDIPSAAIFGYNRNLVTAVANNAKYEEIAFDGFEDYNFLTENTIGSTNEDAKEIAFRRNIDFLKTN